MIAGTSIGALVGGCYLAGKLDELEEFARSLTMRRIAGLLDLTIGGGGLFGGMRLTKRMQEHLEGLRVENLEHPFIAVATELRTGHEVWIHQGDLVTALRSSYALPGIFEPVQCNGRTLIDGALVNPVPVSVCRAYEQALVVAVNLNYDLFGRSAVVKHSSSPRMAQHLPWKVRRAPACRVSWCRPSISFRTGFRARVWRATRPTLCCIPVSTISACQNSIAPAKPSTGDTRKHAPAFPSWSACSRRSDANVHYKYSC